MNRRGHLQLLSRSCSLNLSMHFYPHKEFPSSLVPQPASSFCSNNCSYSWSSRYSNIRFNINSSRNNFSYSMNLSFSSFSSNNNSCSFNCRNSSNNNNFSYNNSSNSSSSSNYNNSKLLLRKYLLNRSTCPRQR